jgi:hypothetical protein
MVVERKQPVNFKYCQDVLSNHEERNDENIFRIPSQVWKKFYGPAYEPPCDQDKSQVPIAHAYKNEKIYGTYQQCERLYGSVEKVICEQGRLLFPRKITEECSYVSAPAVAAPPQIL